MIVDGELSVSKETLERLDQVIFGLNRLSLDKWESVLGNIWIRLNKNNRGFFCIEPFGAVFEMSEKAYGIRVGKKIAHLKDLDVVNKLLVNSRNRKGTLTGLKKP